MPEPNAFAEAGLDRAGHRRADEEWTAAALADPEARAVLVTPEGVAVDPADPSRLLRAPAGEASCEPVLLGMENGHALFARALRNGKPGPPGAAIVGLRELAPVAPPQEAGIAAYATAMLTWHASHGHCARCGVPTRIVDAGHARRCDSCGAMHHPRTDPVVIMLVLDPPNDRILLGRQPSWPSGRFSALAGFVEPGETLEDAVAREVSEEAGVAVRDPRYVSSQPWPFPASLMLGFTATYAGGEPVARDGELEAVRWLTRDEVRAAEREEGGVFLPPQLAIARRLIDGWLAGELSA